MSAKPKHNHIYRKLITYGLTAVVLIAIFAGILPQLGDYGEAIENIQAMSTTAIVVLVIFTVLNILIYTLPLMAALPGLRYWPSFLTRQSYFVMSNAIPGGGALAIGFQVAMLKSYGFTVSQGSASIVITGVWNMLATLFLPGIAALALLVSGQLESNQISTALLAIGISFGVMVLFLVIFRSESIAGKIGDFADRVTKKLLKLVRVHKSISVKKDLLEFRSTSYDVTIHRWHKLAGSNVLQQLSQFSLLFIALQALEPGAISFALALWVYSVAKLGTFIPLTPGGLGTVDAIMTKLLTEAGVSGDVALAATLIWRFTTFLPQIIVGVISFVYWRVKTPSPQK